MKTLFSSAKRILALVLALLLMVPAMSVAFASDTVSVTVGQLMTEKYTLTDAEEALLASGLLNEGTAVTYTVPPSQVEEGNSLVTVNTDDKVVTVNDYDTWDIKTVKIVVSDTEEYDITDTLDSKGYHYTYEGNAFSVVVNYVLNTTIAVDDQAALLAAMAVLKDGYLAMSDAEDISGMLGEDDVVAALDKLVGIAVEENDGEYTIDPGVTFENPIVAAMATIRLDSEVAAAIIDLQNQWMDQTLDFTEMVNNSTSKTQSLVNGEAYALLSEMNDLVAGFTSVRNELAELYEDMAYIAGQLQTWIDQGFGPAYGIDSTHVAALNDLCDLFNELAIGTGVDGDVNEHGTLYIAIYALNSYIDEPHWTTVEALGADGDDTLVKAGITGEEYLELDAKVAALTDFTAVDVTEDFVVTDADVTYKMNMHNVYVNVRLWVVEDVVDSEKQVVAGMAELCLTLADGATKQEIIAAINDSKFVEKTLADWPEYVEGKFDLGYMVFVDGAQYDGNDLSTVLPDDFTLTADISVIHEYTPRMNIVVFNGEDADYTGSDVLPYGYQMTLPKHTDPAQAYDYVVNGTKYAQGSVITITDSTTITRTAGKSYEFGSLYSILAENLGNGKAAAILSSGALSGDVEIAYRVPGDAEVTLSGGTLTADTYASDYEGLYWVPYYTLVNGSTESERQPVNGSVNLSNETYDQVKVYYVLKLTNFVPAYISGVMGDLDGMVNDANNQKATLDRLAAYYDTMGQLDKTKLGALNGVIDVTDLHTDPAKNEELRAYFKSIVSGIIDDNLDGNDLKIYNMLGQYRDESNGGLAWYYQNHEAVRKEIVSLSGYLTDMLADDEKIAALEALVGAAGFPEYKDKIADLETVMSEVKDALTAPNRMIVTDNEVNLKALVAALTGDGEIDTSYSAVPSVELDFTRDAEDKVSVTVEIKIQTGDNTYRTYKEAITKDITYVLTQADIDDLASRALNHVNVDASFYYNDWDIGVLNALVDTEIAAQTITFTWNVKPFEVLVEGCDAQTITILDTTIKLPASSNPAEKWEYVINGRTVSATNSYDFDLENLYSLFTGGGYGYGGFYTVVRIVTDLAKDALDGFISKVNAEIGRNALAPVEENGVYTGITADLTVSDLMGFVMGLVNGGYSYVGLDYEGFVYMNDELTLEASLQTLVNAILNADPAITDATVLANINANGAGALPVTTSIQLGNDADDVTDLDFVLTLDVTGLPKMDMARNLLEKGDSYIDFTTAGDSFAVTVNLPAKVYEVYVTALTLVDSPNVTDNVDLSNINAVNAAVAYEFLLDYIKILATGDITLTTIHNTAAKVGREDAVDQYLDMLGNYGQYVDEALGKLGDALDYDEDNNRVTLDLVAGSGGINKLLDTLAGQLNIPADKLGMAKGLIKECKDGTLSALVTVTVSNFNDTDNDGYIDSNYEAIIVDAGKVDTENLVNSAAAFDITENLAASLANLTGPAVIMLQKDVAGPLYFNTTVILDLNGCDITGGITVGPKGKVFIFDSKMGTTDCGEVTGDITVDGALTVTGGKYEADVTEYLRTGYVQNDGAVSNKFYTISVASNGNITFNVSADIVALNEIPDVKFLAADIAVDLLLNYYTTAALTVDGKTVYNIDFPDLFALLDLDNNTERVNEVLDTVVDMADLSSLVNDIAAKMLDFGTMSAAIKNGDPVITYPVTTAPWVLNVEHNTDGDYIAVGVVPGTTKTVNISVAVTGTPENKQEVIDLLDALEEIKVDEGTGVTINVSDPLTYSNKNLNITAEGKATVEFDLTKDSNYAVILGVVLAYGNDNLKGDMAAAINYYYSRNKATHEIQDVFDNVTVAQVIDALKAMNRSTTFAEMADAIDLEVDVTEAADLEQAYHKLLIVAGALIERVSNLLEQYGYDVDGLSIMDKAMKGVKVFNGTYKIDKLNFNRTGVREIARGFGVAYDLTVTEVSLTVKLFCDHANTETVVENEVPVTCTADGSYDSVVYCTDCGEELSRETVPVPATGHAWGKWTDNCDGLTHSRVCANDPSHIETLGHNFGDDNICDDCDYDKTPSTPVYPPVIPTPGHCPACGKDHCASKQFSDLNVGATSWYHKYTDYVICLELMIGKSETEFVPGGETNRAMLVTTLYRFAGSPAVTGDMPYTDVAEGQWYSDAIIWATQNGVVNGYGNGYFGPFDTLTREQSATIFYRYAKLLGLDVTGSDNELAKYSDADQVSTWAVDGVKWAVSSGMMNGRSTTELILRPKNGTTRAETAALLYRWCEEIAD